MSTKHASMIILRTLLLATQLCIFIVAMILFVKTLYDILEFNITPPRTHTHTPILWLHHEWIECYAFRIFFPCFFFSLSLSPSSYFRYYSTHSCVLMFIGPFSFHTCFKAHNHFHWFTNVYRPWFLNKEKLNRCEFCKVWHLIFFFSFSSFLARWLCCMDFGWNLMENHMFWKNGFNRCSFLTTFNNNSNKNPFILLHFRMFQSHWNRI